MIITKEYQNAFAEVSIILSYIDEADFDKIPQDVISVIEQNKSNDYDYDMNEEIDIFSQPMLPETKAILYNFFRDYWATPEQKQKIIKFQREERYKIEENKRKNYAYENIFKKHENSNNKLVDIDLNNNNRTENITSMQIVKKNNFIVKLFSKIKRWFSK